MNKQRPDLPPELAQHQILGTRESAAFIDYSVPHFRRLVRSGAIPPPIRIGKRKQGWRISTLIEVGRT